MSSTLSPLAIHQILCFSVHDFRRRPRNLRTAAHVPQLGLLARRLSAKWGQIWDLYFSETRPPSLDNVEPPALLLHLKDGLNCADMRVVFGHGKPIEFDDHVPQLLVSKVVQAFLRLRKEPASLNITANLPYAPPTNARRWSGFVSSARGEPVPRLLDDVWPEVYASHLPCTECTTVESLGGCNPRNGLYRLIEKFHVSSKHFDTKLTVELHFTLGKPEESVDEDVPVCPTTASKIEKRELSHVLLYLRHVSCERRPAVTPTTRKSKSILLLPVFASEVYAYLDRVYVGTSLTSNSVLSEVIFNLKNRLPVHHLMCEFEAETVETRFPDPFDPSIDEIRCAFAGAYWMILHHFRRDLTYRDVRRFKLPSVDRTAADCALIRRYLGSSHVADFKTPYSDGRFSLKMLAALLSGHNCSLGRLRMGALDGQLTDYRAMEVVFGGGVRLDALSLSISTQGLAYLIKTTDFLRLSTIQGLTELKFLPVNLIYGRQRTYKSWTRREQAILGAPLWYAGIRLLRNCARYHVHYDGANSQLKSIALKLVQTCEKFERGEDVEICEHFSLKVPHRIKFPFNARNRNGSMDSFGAGGPQLRSDVYRFRNAANGEWLTVYVEHRAYYRSAASVVHIMKGQSLPESVYDF